nr:MAG TPA: hypothetical protein [Caudoviricetes sp.]DAL30403.1 MAG TPA_asm: hypothetical protein [Caudoviricetes sp.]DAY60510.1 MAG TPA: hypothetical protein [Caudoviricetes sp.]
MLWLCYLLIFLRPNLLASIAERCRHMALALHC